MASLREFDVFEETTTKAIAHRGKGTIIPTKWVLKWKGNDVKARICAKGFVQHGLDSDMTFASTPALSTAKVLLALAASKGWKCLLGDISTAFLHAALAEDEEIYVQPPPEYYSDPDVIWKLKKALYGLKTSPRNWQDHFADTVQRLGATRLKSDPNVDHFKKENTIVMSYVDDLLIVGEQADHIMSLLRKEFLLKETSRLEDGQRAEFLGRTIRRDGDNFVLGCKNDYIHDILETMSMQNCKGSSTPGTTALKNPGGASLLQTEDVTHYRSVVGKLMWLIPLRPDLNFATKELSRALQEPTEEDYSEMKHWVKYLAATRNYEFVISPGDYASSNRATITAYVDSDWAGCKATRKSTSGGVLHFNGVCVHHYSRTQTTVALSSGEAELYALGSGVSEALGLKNFLHELGMVSTITVCTDSSAARSITTRHGVTKQTKHIQLRFFVHARTSGIWSYLMW